MDTKLALEKGRQLGISVVQIVREEYEIYLLSRIFDSPLGTKLIFKGGTALRLAYNSPRFSDDLDFTQLEPISDGEFQKWCEETAQGSPNLELVEARKKQFTLFALFRIRDSVLEATISIKVEISTRAGKWEKGLDYSLIQLKSEVTPLTVLAQVASPKKIQEEKLSISPLRIRDIFDLWFLGQQLDESYQMSFVGFKAAEVKRELHRLLALGARRMIESWLPKD